MNKPKLYCFFTPSHEEFYENFLKPSSEEYDVRPIFFEKQLSDSGEYREQGWRETQYNKVLAWKKAVEENMGEVIVCSDVDVQFLNDSYEYLKDFLKSDDIAFQENDLKGKICSGFFVCRCSLQTQNFFEIVAKRLHDIMHEKGGGEQYVMQSLLDEGWLQLNWKKIPRDKVWNPGVKYSDPSELNVPENLIAHHANWVEGNENKKKQLEYVKSLYFSSNEPDEIEIQNFSSNLEQSSIALCISSLLRYFDIGSKSLIEKIINTLPDKPDLFGHFPVECQTEENLKILEEIKTHCNNNFIVFEPDYVDEKYINFSHNLNSFQRNGMKGNLLQWISMLKCRNLKISSENFYGKKYECVIWTRPDLYYFNSLENINNLREYELYIPAHDNHFCGLFDRFCLGSSELMDMRMAIFEYFVNIWYKKQLEDKNILFYNDRSKSYQWNPELVFKSLIYDQMKVEHGKLNLCSGKIRENRRIRVPFWHNVQGSGNPTSVECEEDIVNPEVLKLIYSKKEIIPDKNGAWFEIVI